MESSSSAAVPSQITIRPARPAEAAPLASLMTDAISWGRLGDLGPGFVRLLHTHLITSRHSVCLVAEDNGRLLGYIAASTDTSRFYREFLVRHGLRAGLLVLPRLWRPRNLATTLRGLTHFPSAPADDPPSEALSFAVQRGIKERGIGSQLFHAIIAALKERGVAAVKFATVASDNVAGNAFYQKLGCRLVRTVPFYRESLVNVYVYQLGDA